MNSRWLILLGLWMLACTSLRAQAPGAVKPVGYLLLREVPTNYHQPRFASYLPQPGDIILYDDMNPFYNFLFKIANTAPPTHTAIVIAGADGQPALLELTGPKVMTARVQIMEVEPRLRYYPGTVEVRRIRQPLSAEQARDLTAFAEAQTGKSFAWPRVILQGTPFCPRSGLRRELFGHTYLNRNRWFCSELVVAACASARIVDGKSCCANATLPRDLAVDDWLDLSGHYHPPLRWTPEMPRILTRGTP